MTKRFFSKNQLVFTVEGRPLSRGNSMGHGVSGGASEFKQLVRLAAKMAMAEQGWKKTKKAVYMAIIIYLSPSEAKRLHYKPNIEKLKNDKIFAIKTPNIERIATVVVNALRGIVYDVGKQVVGLVTVKKYAKEPRIEVLIGEPEDFKELKHDLRNI